MDAQQTVDLSHEPGSVYRRRSRSASPKRGSQTGRRERSPPHGSPRSPSELSQHPSQSRASSRSEGHFSHHTIDRHSRASSLSAPRYHHLTTEQHHERDAISPSPRPSDISGHSSPYPFSAAQARRSRESHYASRSQSPSISGFAPSRSPSIPASLEDIKHMHIEELFWIPSVATLHEKYLRTKEENLRMKERVDQLLDQEKYLFERSKKADILFEKVQQLETELGHSGQYVSHGGSSWGSTNTHHHMQAAGSNALPPIPPDSNTRLGNSAQRPNNVHHAILWTFEDSKRDPMTAFSSSNSSRPGMASCIRHPLTGEAVSSGEYRAICISARTIGDELAKEIRSLRGPADSQKITKSYSATHYPRQWSNALLQLEYQQPILAFCADHWKASHVLMSILHNLKLPTSSQSSQETVPRHKRARSARSSVSRSPDAPQGERSVEGAPAHTTNNLTKSFVAKPTPKARNKLLSSRNKGKGKATEQCSPSNATSASFQEASPSRTLTATLPQNEQRSLSSTSFHQAPFTKAAALPEDEQPPSSNAAAVLDVAFVKVDAGFENLKGIMMSQYPSNDAAIKLLNALCSNPSCGCSAPSNSIIQLISHIESADPNNPELDEDDLGLSWGHAQYKGWSTYLRTWQDIGTPETACSLIAAFVKTSKVARYLCQQKNIDIEGKTLLSDSYLTELTEKLWQLWQNTMNTNDYPSISGGQLPSLATIPKKDLEALTVSALRKFSVDHSLALKEKAAKKDVLVSFISSALETNPTLNDPMCQLIEASLQSKLKVSRSSGVSK
ncbi:hypothetical protein M378DRAFT_159870 [Amanita muscaria Koide BX008]|uniref:Uncharacterized protein n=1 Tax=Amanita muscaria (strain Koide BX008) TaxID=946122 RepID=A0A0C2WYN3_AMAMK|nr:hypothetical protein M378DRAFT_159870 [Amanita muscaria Koide BX008]